VEFSSWNSARRPGTVITSSDTKVISRAQQNDEGDQGDVDGGGFDAFGVDDDVGAAVVDGGWRCG
jgi:hypothetical protein